MPQQLTADSRLLERIAANEPQAFEQLYAQYWESLYLFAYRRLQSTAAAKDIVQDIFINIWERRSELVLHGSLTAYLHAAVRYKVIEKLSVLLKDRQRSSQLAAMVTGSFNDADTVIREKELIALIGQKIDLLPARMREVYLLSREEKLPVSEIASRLNLSEQTIKNQLTSALARLKDGLKEAASFLFTIW
ncbi:RNA polymerase sigma factor [Deminuibacter soli]|uniref:RNA polymerase sigma-70 factor n=1 Tax=Deminuibacter soli TaxID=2291815 RepID=A0A3E1NGQ0_9BACT|nr:RNA polymerase sigma-70 factor [Deminuibacter soli]RFM27014.1 RNA polymerase sigma-70 factor [Deminuibacter soli]